MTEQPSETHSTCPDCGANGALTVWANGNTYCHSCLKTKTAKGKSMEVYEEPGLTLITKPLRGVDKDVEEFYNVKTGVDTNGNDKTRIYPYPHRIKVRVLPKDFSKNPGFSNDWLFGMDKFNAGSSKALTIVEGEEDALATYQMLGKKWPVVSLPSAGAIKRVLQNKEAYNYLKAFTSLVIATDSDDAGEAAADVLQRAFPGKCYRVNMSTYKDPCEYFQKGAAQDFLYAWINRQKYVPENVYNTPEQFESIIKDDKGSMYLPTGIKTLDEKILGLMQGYLTVFTAPEGIGKTEFMRKLEYTMLSEHPTVPIAVMHLEESKKRTLLGLASYQLQKDVTLQDTETITNEDGDEEIVYLPSYKGTPEEEVLGAVREFSGHGNLYQFTMSVDDDPMSILEQIRYFSEVCGCKYIFFEPIQDIGYARQNDSTLEAFLSELVTKLALLATELGVGIVTIAHENDDGLIRDCRMIGKRAGVVIKLSRDKHAVDQDEANTTKLLVDKNRPVGPTGYGGLLEFDPQTFTLSEKEF